MHNRIITLLALQVALLIFAGQSAAESAESPEASQRAASADPGPADAWPAAVRRFWEERASETRRINGELWCIRVRLAGEKQAAINTPAAQELALAYQQPGAPIYIRLRDGKQAVRLADIARDIEGVTVLEGLVIAVEGCAMTFRPIKPRDGHGYAATIRIEGLSPEQQAHYRSLVVTPEQLKERKTTQRGHTKPHVFVPTRMATTPGKPSSYTVVELLEEEVPPEEVRQACRSDGVIAWPDRRLILQSPAKPYITMTGTTRELAEYKWQAERFDRQDFRWSDHSILIAPAAR